MIPGFFPPVPPKADEDRRRSGRGAVPRAPAKQSAEDLPEGFVLDSDLPLGFVLDESSGPSPAAATISAIARPVLEMGGGIGGAMLAGGGAAPTGPGAIPSAMVGGGLGFAAGKSAADLLDRGLGLRPPLKTGGEALAETGKNIAAGVESELLGATAGPVLKVAGAAAKGLGRAAVNNPVARAVGNYTNEAAERLMARANQVVAHLGTEDAVGGKLYEAARAFKESLLENKELAGEKYRLLINKVVGENAKYGPGYRLDLQAGLADDAAKVLKESGYGMPGRRTDQADAEKFLGFVRRVNELSTATADEVYWFQRDLNNAMGEGNSPTLNRHFGEMKKSLTKFLEKSIPEIGEANRIYAQASDLSDDLARIDSADDAAKAILSKSRAYGSETRKAILAAAAALPKAQKQLDELLDLDAARQFSKGMPDIPRTGGGAAALMGINHVYNPAATLTAMLGLGGVSPLATAHVTRAAQALASRFPGGPAMGTPAASATGSALQQLIRMANGEPPAGRRGGAVDDVLRAAAERRR